MHGECGMIEGEKRSIQSFGGETSKKETTSKI